MPVDNIKNSKVLILFTYFSLGACALISQTMILREFFVVVYGNELIFGILLTNWLAGIFAGALTGGWISERSKNNLLLLVISLLAMCILLPLSITFIRLLYRISGTNAGDYIGFIKVFWYSACFIIPISFFIGFVFPIAAKVQTHRLQKSSLSQGGNSLKAGFVKGISTIYIFEAFGSLFSGIVYTFLLAGQLNAYFIAAMITMPLVACACLLLWRRKFYKTFTVAAAILILNAISCLPSVNNQFERITVKNRWQSVSNLPLSYSTESRYQNIAVANLSNQYNVYLNTMFSSVFPNDQDNMVLAAHLVCQHPKPRRILVIGDAVTGLAKFLLRFNVEEVISVEIDAKIVDSILLFLPAEDKKILEDPRFKIIIKDGRKYVKDLVLAAQEETGTPDPKFDMVYVNVSEPSTLLLNRYYTTEFFSDLRHVMTETGVVALKITSSENYDKGYVGNYTTSIYHTVKKTFPHMAVTPGKQNFIFASGAAGIVSDNPEQLETRYDGYGVEPLRLGMIFQSLYPEEKTQFIKNALERGGSGVVNTDEIPIATLYFNKIIGWYGSSRVSGLLGFFESIRFRDITFLLLLLFLFRLLYSSVSLHRNPGLHYRVLRFHTLVAVFASGLAALSLELVILYSFQNSYGNVYHIIGFIIAVFMFGLPLGAACSNWLMSKKSFSSDNRVVNLICFIQVLTAVIAYTLPGVMKFSLKVIWLNQMFILLATILIGFSIGLVFPLSIRIYMGNERKVGKTAGIIDAYDHFGAAVGAFIIGTLLLPVIGVEKVCRLVALFPLMAAILLFIDTTRSAEAIRKERGAGRLEK